MYILVNIIFLFKNPTIWLHTATRIPTITLKQSFYQKSWVLVSFPTCSFTLDYPTGINFTHQCKIRFFFCFWDILSESWFCRRLPSRAKASLDHSNVYNGTNLKTPSPSILHILKKKFYRSKRWWKYPSTAIQSDFCAESLIMFKLRSFMSLSTHSCITNHRLRFCDSKESRKEIQA